MKRVDSALKEGNGSEPARQRLFQYALLRGACSILQRALGMEGAHESWRPCDPPTLRPSCHVRRSWRRRGSIYIAVLGIALIVTVIGISAMLAARVELRALTDTESAAKAELAAASTLDLALFWITANRNWRTTFTNDTWTPAVLADGTTLRIKVVDELDGNLANDPTQPVRLYAKAIVGPAVRIESVLCQPSSGYSLITNGGMESGGVGWYTRNGLIEIRTDGAHSGADYVRVKSRTLVTDGLGQTLLAGLKNGTTYQIDVWVKMKSGSDSLTVGILTNSTLGGYSTLYSPSTAIGTAWQKVTATLTPTWTGVLLSADLYMYTTATKTEFDVDDVAMTEQSTQPSLIPIPGTWRQEIRSAPVGELPAMPS